MEQSKLTVADASLVKDTDNSSPTIALAAVFYRDGEGGAADRVLAAAASRFRAEGVRLGGVIQHNSDCGDRSCCTMTLEDLASGQMIKISEDRGPHATGCRLDSSALEEAVGLVASAIDAGADVLIINKFGKRECEGHGFRSVIDAALSAGIPVLAGVNEQSASGWKEYAQDMGQVLSLDEETVLAWLREALPAKA